MHLEIHLARVCVSCDEPADPKNGFRAAYEAGLGKYIAEHDLKPIGRLGAELEPEK